MRWEQRYTDLISIIYNGDEIDDNFNETLFNSNTKSHESSFKNKDFVLYIDAYPQKSEIKNLDTCAMTRVWLAVNPVNSPPINIQYWRLSYELEPNATCKEGVSIGVEV